MVKCCVVFCTSGYKSNPEKISQFCVPKDLTLRAKWARAIPRKDFVLTDKTYVCSKHFHEDDIIRFWESGTKETMIVKVPYKQPRLKEGAIPTIFPGPSYLSTIKKNRKLNSRKVEVNAIMKTKDNVKINPSNFINDDVHLTNFAFSEDNLFEALCKLQYSPPWFKKTNCDTSLDELCVFTLCTKTQLPVVEKCIKVDKSSQISYWIFGKKIEIIELNITPATSIEEFLDSVKSFECISVCHGGPKAEDFPEAPTTLCTKSCSELLKHNECCLLIKSKAKSCNKCKTLQNVLVLKEKRKAAGCEEILKLSPKKKKKVAELRKRAHHLHRTVVNNYKKINELQQELIVAQQNMAKYTDDVIQDKMMGMNDSQKSLVMECFAASS